MPPIISIYEHITAIDHELLGAHGIGVTYVVRGDPDHVALVETGTSLTVPNTLAGLDQLGIPRQAVRHIICTHIHMDHAGGAGALAAALPQATVYIHSMSAAHLIDPARLIASSRRAVGEELWPLQGTVVPLTADRLHSAESCELDLGRGVSLRAIPTPGHSPDHLAFLDERSGALFSGDAAGVRLPHYGVEPRPVAPPPTFDLEQQIATYERLRSMPIARLLVTHYGPADDVDATLRQQHIKLLEVAEAVRIAVERDELDASTLVQRLLPPGDNLVVRVWADMTIAGLARYFRKRAEKESQRG